jgi:hypothetical protein
MSTPPSIKVCHNGVVSEFQVQPPAPFADGPKVSFGLEMKGFGFSLTIASELKRLVTYSNIPVSLFLECRYEVDKLRLVRVEVQNVEGKYISTRDLMHLKLPAILREISLGAVENAHTFMGHARKTLNSPASLRNNLDVLAQLYWLEVVTWGTPRKTIMELSGCSRSTANECITLASKEYRMPNERIDDFDPLKPRKIASDTWLIPYPEADDQD